MKISEKQVDEFVSLYKQEYDVELERTEALEQINALIIIVSRMLPNPALLEESIELKYNVSGVK